MSSESAQDTSVHSDDSIDLAFDWHEIARLVLTSRAIDRTEETELVPQKKVLYQFSARGHDLAQVLLGSLLNHPHDATSGYYRSRPSLLAIGLSVEEAFAGPLARSGGFSDGRDIGVVFNRPTEGGATVLPMCGGVGAQYTPVAGWAQAIRYHADELGDSSYQGAIAVALGGDASVATNGFWSALTMATTLKLPMLFYIDDNGYGISTPSTLQTPGANIARNLRSFENLQVLDGDGTEPAEAASLIRQAVDHVRSDVGPALLRLSVPRLEGHSAQDTQAYKSAEFIAAEEARDPLPKLRDYLVPELIDEDSWKRLEEDVEREVADALAAALARAQPDSAGIERHVFCETGPDDKPEVQQQGGLAAGAHVFPESSEQPEPEPTRINMLTAIRRTLEYELANNPKVTVFGQDVGPKGGVHAATMGLQEKFGVNRVFDTSLSEEGIIGRAVGMAVAGLMPVPEIQFRKYADPATEQLNDCGTMRWRTNNRFAAPIVVRIPGGFFKCGDPWHSQTNEVQWAHGIGWQVAVPSNAEDATGRFRAALSTNNPTLFFEHLSMLDDASARRPYPGDKYVLPFGKAKITRPGTDLTVVTWGAMVPRCEAAADQVDGSVEVIDLRTMMPWDRNAVLSSIAKTRRCLVVHEDNITAGFGAEIVATVASKSFFDLDAPIERVAMPDIPSPHNPKLMNAVVPDAAAIAEKMTELLEC
ncbi:MAG: thiamine pyrophosphate-dependent enzyme [Gammaproteobacteria bacterium]|nr:thiamine pyrophosphate-dependent enzyme [Gammaproteobacteria bacterium]